MLARQIRKLLESLDVFGMTKEETVEFYAIYRRFEMQGTISLEQMDALKRIEKRVGLLPESLLKDKETSLAGLVEAIKAKNALKKKQ